MKDRAVTQTRAVRIIPIGRDATSNVMRGRPAAFNALGEPGMRLIPARSRKKGRPRFIVVATLGRAWIDTAGRVLAARYELGRVRQVTVCPP